MSESSATAAARQWLARLEEALLRGDAAAAAACFGTECWWRDMVALTWNIRTEEGREAIARMLGAVSILDGQAVFVKMTGPDAEVNAERDNFIAFCQSLK